MNRKKIFGFGAIGLMILLAIAPAINALQEHKGKDISTVSTGGYDLYLEIESIDAIGAEEINGSEEINVIYELKYSISNVGDKVYQDEGWTLISLKEKDTLLVINYWKIENLKIEPGETKRFTQRISVRSSPDFGSATNIERKYALRNLIIDVDSGPADVDQDNNLDGRFSNLMKYLEKNRPTLTHLYNAVPSTKLLEKYVVININGTKIEIPSFFEGYEGIIVKLRSILKSNHLGYIGEAAIYILNISADLAKMLVATLSFLVGISEPLKVIADWLKDVILFFTSVSEGVWIPGSFAKILSNFVRFVVPAIEVIVVAAAIYGGEMMYLAKKLETHIDEFMDWQAQEPWDKPIIIFGECINVKEGKTVKFYDYKDRYIGEVTSGSDKKVKFNFTRNIDEDEYPGLPHNCRIKAVYGSQVKYSKLIHSWAFSNGSFQWTFKFKDKNVMEETDFIELTLIEKIKVLLKNSLPLMILSQFKNKNTPLVRIDTIFTKDFQLNNSAIGLKKEIIKSGYDDLTCKRDYIKSSSDSRLHKLILPKYMNKMYYVKSNYLQKYNRILRKVCQNEYDY